MEKMNGSGSKPSADMVSEPVESYYGISSSPKVNMSPLDTLEQLGELVRATGKSPEQMCEEHLKEKYMM